MIKWTKKDVLEAAITLVSPFEKAPQNGNGLGQKRDRASIVQELRRVAGRPPQR